MKIKNSLILAISATMLAALVAGGLWLWQWMRPCPNCGESFGSVSMEQMEKRYQSLDCLGLFNLRTGRWASFEPAAGATGSLQFEDANMQLRYRRSPSDEPTDLNLKIHEITDSQIITCHTNIGLYYDYYPDSGELYMKLRVQRPGEEPVRLHLRLIKEAPQEFQ